jgi:hypothetical protein
MWRLFGLLLLVPAVAAAQSFTGSYAVQSQQGGTITLTLRQDAQGTLTGSMTGNDVQYQVEGMLEEGVAVGAIYNEQGGVYFEAQLQGGQLLLTMIEPGPDNQPDYSKTQDLVLMRQGAIAGATPQQPGVPAQGGNRFGRAAAAPAGQGSGLLGSWSCQSNEGQARIVFAERQLTYNGEAMSYELVEGAIRVPGDWGPMDYRYELSGNNLTISGPDGSHFQCSRQQNAPQTRAAGGGGMERVLEGKLCSYSASPDGGYSTQHLLMFNGRGRFWYGVETAWDIPETTGISWNWENGENVGSYQVTGNNKGDAVYLQFADGQVGTARVFHVYQGEIREVFLEGPDRHYAKGLCEGG